jgi:hypothetical protein
MSVTIHWRPVNDKGKHFHGGTSTSLARLQDVFGDIIRAGDIPALRAMAVAAQDDFYTEVSDMVERVGDITVWGEW